MLKDRFTTIMKSYGGLKPSKKGQQEAKQEQKQLLLKMAQEHVFTDSEKDALQIIKDETIAIHKQQKQDKHALDS